MRGYPPRWMYVSFMSKRALLWTIGSCALFFTYLAAANVPSPYGSYCSFNFTRWFTPNCNASLPQRLGVMMIGLVILVVCAYFAEKDGREELARGKQLGHPMVSDPGLGWVCANKRCGFVGNRSEALDHVRDQELKKKLDRISTPDRGVSVPAAGTTASVNPAPLAPGNPALKTCPDCAEEVRGAARKCRFCGYLFGAESGGTL